MANAGELPPPSAVKQVIPAQQTTPAQPAAQAAQTGESPDKGPGKAAKPAPQIPETIGVPNFTTMAEDETIAGPMGDSPASDSTNNPNNNDGAEVPNTARLTRSDAVTGNLSLTEIAGTIDTSAKLVETGITNNTVTGATATNAATVTLPLEATSANYSANAIPVPPDKAYSADPSTIVNVAVEIYNQFGNSDGQAGISESEWKYGLDFFATRKFRDQSDSNLSLAASARQLQNVNFRDLNHALFSYQSIPRTDQGEGTTITVEDINEMRARKNNNMDAINRQINAQYGANLNTDVGAAAFINSLVGDDIVTSVANTFGAARVDGKVQTAEAIAATVVRDPTMQEYATFYKDLVVEGIRAEFTQARAETIKASAAFQRAQPYLNSNTAIRFALERWINTDPSISPSERKSYNWLLFNGPKP
jgi:hypothetical protein